MPGVSWCATCDGFFFRDQDIAVAGGGDSAMEEATFLTRFGRTVTVIHRRDSLRASKIMQERAFANPKIKFRCNSEVTEILGEAKITGLRLRDTVTGEESTLEVGGLFVAIGHDPRSGLFTGQRKPKGRQDGRVIHHRPGDPRVPDRRHPYRQAGLPVPRRASAGHAGLVHPRGRHRGPQHGQGHGQGPLPDPRSRVSLCVDLEAPPYAFVQVQGDAELSEELSELVRTATLIGARYMGPELAAEFGQRNGVPGELVVRIRPAKVLAAFDMTG